MANYFHMTRIAMLCAEHNIRAYTRVEGDTQTVRLGIFPSWINPHHARTAEKIRANRAALTVARERITRAGCRLPARAYHVQYWALATTFE